MKKSEKKPEAFDARLARLKQIVEALESGDAPLEKSVDLYKEGLVLSAALRDQLDRAKNAVEVATEAGIKPLAPGDPLSADPDPAKS